MLLLSSKSKNPTTVMTANGEVVTVEEATVYVKELDLFVTVVLLADTPAALSLGKLSDDHGSKTTSHQKWQENQLHYVELRAFRCSWSVDEFLYFIFTYFNIFIAGDCDRHGKSSSRKK